VSALSEFEQQAMFTHWMGKHDKAYATNTELFYRYSTFKDNVQFINEHNAGNHSYTLAINQYADMTITEFRRMHGVRANLADARAPAVTHSCGRVDPFDWQRLGAVTGVKNQGACGSSWAFAAAGAIEGSWFVAKRQLVELSEQQLLDCAGHGCDGGMMDEAYEWVLANHGIASSRDYPYTARKGQCKQVASTATISGYSIVAQNEDALLTALVGRPVAVAIDASKQSFQFYHAGVYDDTSCGRDLDLGLVLVGYGVGADGSEFWRLKNQWGASWGESGFIRMVKGSNICGISDAASFTLSP
jgi:cathepsin L